MKSVAELKPVSSIISVIRLYRGFGIFIVTRSCALILGSNLSLAGLD
jgi:hypothetical protein